MRAFRWLFTSLPIPGIVNEPAFLVSVIAVFASTSRISEAPALVSSHLSARCDTICALVIGFEAMSFLLQLLACDDSNLESSVSIGESMDSVLFVKSENGFFAQMMRFFEDFQNRGKNAIWGSGRAWCENTEVRCNRFVVNDLAHT